MRVTIIHEAGYEAALFGIGLSFGLTSDINAHDFIWDNAALWDRMEKRAKALAGMGQGHDKFLRQLMMWVDVDAPLYWWKQFDQYGHTVTQSESTMHTLMKRELTQDDFENEIDPRLISLINSFINAGAFQMANGHLPHSFLQRRIVSMNYATAFTIIQQRTGHKLPEWKLFIDEIKRQAQHGFLFANIKKKQEADDRV